MQQKYKPKTKAWQKQDEHKVNTYSEWVDRQVNKVIDTQQKISEIGDSRLRLEPFVEKFMKHNRFEKGCNKLIMSKNPNDRFVGLVSITNSHLLPKYLNKILDMYYKEKMDDLRATIVMSVVDFLDYVDEFSTNKNINLLFDNHSQIKNLLIDSLDDPSEIVKDAGVYAMGASMDPLFIPHIREQLWTNLNAIIRGTAANSLYEIMSVNPSCRVAGKTLYIELKRAYLEDSDIRMSLVNPMTNTVIETNDPNMAEDFISVLENLQMKHMCDLSTFLYLNDTLKHLNSTFFGFYE
jgi:hypothetical protein